MSNNFRLHNRAQLVQSRFEVAIRAAVADAIDERVDPEFIVDGLRYVAAEIEEADAPAVAPAPTAEEVLGRAVRALATPNQFMRRADAYAGLSQPVQYDQSADGEDEVEVVPAPGVGPEWERPVRGDAHREATDNRNSVVNNVIIVAEEPTPSGDFPVGYAMPGDNVQY